MTAEDQMFKTQKINSRQCDNRNKREKLHIHAGQAWLRPRKKVYFSSNYHIAAPALALVPHVMRLQSYPHTWFVIDIYKRPGAVADTALVALGAEPGFRVCFTQNAFPLDTVTSSGLYRPPLLHSHQKLSPRRDCIDHRYSISPDTVTSSGLHRPPLLHSHQKLSPRQDCIDHRYSISPDTVTSSGLYRPSLLHSHQKLSPRWDLIDHRYAIFTRHCHLLGTLSTTVTPFSSETVTSSGLYRPPLLHFTRHYTVTSSGLYRPPLLHSHQKLSPRRDLIDHRYAIFTRHCHLLGTVSTTVTPFSSETVTSSGLYRPPLLHFTRHCHLVGTVRPPLLHSHQTLSPRRDCIDHRYAIFTRHCHLVGTVSTTVTPFSPDTVTSSGLYRPPLLHSHQELSLRRDCIDHRYAIFTRHCHLVATVSTTVTSFLSDTVTSSGLYRPPSLHSHQTLSPRRDCIDHRYAIFTRHCYLVGTVSTTVTPFSPDTVTLSGLYRPPLLNSYQTLSPRRDCIDHRYSILTRHCHFVGTVSITVTPFSPDTGISPGLTA
ncbi:hypothetical protein EVAR_61683_1 [Eumeta japonica]|uniref:Uncharacterized protein n=1 Tax=Eumeta variegata TaxID=151549 RepID=A0A4C2A1A1_EUMVA|nr:hypothetical protein EVAR_61683_1 [Eumeta japonica]